MSCKIFILESIVVFDWQIYGKRMILYKCKGGYVDFFS